MPEDKRQRRFSVSMPLIKEIRLALWAHTRGVSKTRMAEAILVDRVSSEGNWNEVCQDLRQEAAINQLELNDLIKEILKSNGYGDVVELDNINWTEFLSNEKAAEQGDVSDE